ncbi:hypothetical protein [Bosea sp. 685]|uniref:hypothetical protein n=1 Tax=Bosea sp. 685 TaxID=3080057 RepID=UPI0028936AA8|nr:hypothetical protein [Bosea sp. 685]WNJ89584.1 hypothetical protein RMR04_24755 [Bosea sp. 685]
MSDDPIKAFKDAMPGWEIVPDGAKKGEAPAAQAGTRVDRVAGEDSFVRDRYFGVAPDVFIGADPFFSTASGGGLIADESTHSEFIRATKKGSQDSLIGEKTFIVTKNKIVGSQG